MTVQWVHRVLTTKVGRRLLVLLLVIGVVPFTVFAVVAYREVSEELQAQTRSNLRQVAKRAGLSIYDRLLLLDSDLRTQASTVLEGAPPRLDLRPDTGAFAGPTRLLGAAVVRDGGISERTGRIRGGLPAPDSLQRAHLAAGRTLLHTETRPTRRILMARALDPADPSRGVLWAEVNPDFLWRAADPSEGDGRETLCVFDEEGSPLLCPVPDPEGILARARASGGGMDTGEFEWNAPDGDRHLGAYWTLFLKYHFETDAWTILRARPRATVLAAVEDFRSLAPLVALLMVLLVFLVSHREVRLRMDPLAELQEGTRKLARGDFEARVEVESGDEFQELAESFNWMTGRLREEFTRRAEATRALEERTRELRDHEARLRTIVESAADGILTMDPEGRILKLNRTAERMFGVDRDQVRHREGGTLFEEAPDWSALSVRSAREGGVGGAVEVTGRRGDGSTFPAEVVAREVVPGGRQPLVIAFVRDLSERRAEERKRRRLERRLRQKQKLETVGTLAGGIAHDFNNLLTPILGNVDLSLMDVSTGSDLEENLLEIRQAALRAQQLIGQILIFSRRESGQREVVQVEPVLREALKLLRSTLPSSIELEAEIGEDVPPVMGDSTQLQQVIMNLCTNAFHAIRSGSSLRGTVTVTLDAVPGSGDGPGGDAAPEEEPRGRVRLRIADTGPGIEAEVRERMFEPFFTTKDPGEGTGLGLSVVHGIVESHGGDIRVESDPDRGTTFTILLPAAAAAPAVEPGRSDAPEEEPTRTGQVLQVGEDPVVARAAARALDRMGYAVTSVGRADEARRIFETDPEAFDLLLADDSGEDGRSRTLARSLHRRRPELPVVVMTDSTGGAPSGSGDDEIDAVLEKPFHMDDLATIVDTLLRESRSPSRGGKTAP